MFLLFDYVCLIKSIQNKWITESCQELDFYADGERKTAKWADIITLYNLEANQIVKLSKLTEVSVYPKPIEKQRVSTCLQVFCDETLSRSSSEVFCKRDVLKNFTKFTGKHLCQSLFLNEVAGLRLLL